MTIGRIAGYILGTILLGIGSAIGSHLIKKAEKTIRDMKDKDKNENDEPTCPPAVSA